MSNEIVWIAGIFIKVVLYLKEIINLNGILKLNAPGPLYPSTF